MLLAAMKVLSKRGEDRHESGQTAQVVLENLIVLVWAVEDHSA